MPTGQIKWFSVTKGYGFLTRDDGTDVFVHATALAAGEDRHLVPGDRVEFEEISGEKGRKAVALRRCPSTPPRDGALPDEKKEPSP